MDSRHVAEWARRTRVSARSRMTKKMVLLVTGSAVVLCLAGGGIAYAAGAIPGTNGVINGL